MNPPNVYDVTSPAAHSTNSITKTVQSMFLYSFRDQEVQASVQSRTFRAEHSLGNMP